MAQVCSKTWHVVLPVHGLPKVLHTVCEPIRIASMITVLSVTRRVFKDGMNKKNLFPKIEIMSVTTRYSFLSWH